MKKLLFVLPLLFTTAALAQATQRAPLTAPPIAPQIAAPIPAQVAAQKPAAAAKPTGVIAREGCVTSQCHAEVKNYKVLHGPVNVNACDACHKLTDPATHTFQLARNKTETCTFCHQLDMHNNPVIHKPVTDGQCLACHNPHGGASNKFTRGKSTRELCATCHKDPVGDKTHIHGPVAAGSCDACHTGHSSKFPKLLPAQGRDLCLTCHNEMKTQMASAKVIHKAVEGDCNKCHDPHASNFTMQIKSDPLTLCTSCHEHDKIKNAAMTSTVKHSVVMKDQACLNCHTAHGGDLAKLMRAEPIKVCMKCHTEDQKAADGHIARNVAVVLDPNMSKHGPIRDGNCSGCHNPHGSTVPRLLAKPYPQAFYQRFSEDKYELCFSCHDKQLVETQKTANLTGFRNGDRNLHFVHVNKEKGRNCRSCHETHASQNERHIRNSVPFGQWEMPLKFVKAQSGGTCSPGCHKPFTYDRDHPVNYQMPGVLPGPTPGASTPAPTSPAPVVAAPATPSPAVQPPPAVVPPPPVVIPAPASPVPSAVSPPPAVVPPPAVAPAPVPQAPSAVSPPPAVVPPPPAANGENPKLSFE